MTQDWEYKVVKVPMNQPGRRQRILNGYARDGWELTETNRGALLSVKDQVTLRRSKGETAQRKADDKATATAARAERVAKYEAKTPQQKRNYWIGWGIFFAALVIFCIAVSVG